MEGKLRLEPPEAPGPDLRFDGEVTIEDFASIDNTLKQDFVNFKRLELRKVSYTMGPDSASIDEVRVIRPFARVIISPERVINISAVLDPKGTAAALQARRAEAAAEAALTPAQRRERDRAREAAEERADEGAQGPRQGAGAGAGPHAEGDHAGAHPPGSHRAGHAGFCRPQRAAQFRGARAAGRRNHERAVERPRVARQGRPEGQGRRILAGHDHGRGAALLVRALCGHRPQVREHLAADLQSLLRPLRGLRHRQGQAHHRPSLPDHEPQSRREAPHRHRPARVGRGDRRTRARPRCR